MSTTIDQRVVEMRFDNRQFERGVSDTMSTLDKLKQKLNFKGAVQGVESVNTAARNVQSNMGGLSHSVEAVSLKFSALQVMGVTALANITNSAVNAGKRIVSALTIDPVRSGFQEYETQINAVQTILANTSHAGTTIDDVNKALRELNEYADMTIYNFTEMTRNIGTFTAAGIDLKTSTSAIKGIANLAAVSGSTSQQASTAMYQLSQALAAGRVSLMDWNSVVNAGMGGKVFQDALTRTADVMNKGAGSKAIKKYGSFRESLTKGEWLTVDVLTETLNQFTMSAKEGSEEWEKYKASLKEKGYTEAQATEILKMANTATDAATKVKTFTQLWDVLKESAQSGWTQTWNLIIGDFEEAKNLLTPVSDVLTKLIGKMSDFRNKIIESAFGRTFSSLSEKFNTILKPAKKIGEAVGKVSMSLEELDKIATEVIRGNFGNGKERIDKLTEAGINYYRVQNKVNEKLDCSKRFSEEQIEAQDKLLGIQTKNTDKTGEQADATIELSDAQKKQLVEMSKLSDAQLRQKGYTDEQIEALRELQKVAESIGVPFDEFLDQINEINGRWLFINSFKNIGNALADVGVVIKTAWKDVFPEHSIEHFANKLFNLLGTFHRVTAAMSDMLRIQVGTKLEDGVEKPIYKLTEAGENLVRVFKGIFAAFDIVTTVVGGAFKFAFKIVAELFDRFGLSVLEVLAIVADSIVAFRDWLDEIFNVSKAVDVLVPIVKGAAKFVKNLITAVKNSKWFKDFCNYVEKAADGLGKFFANIPNTDVFHKLVKALKDAGEALSDWTKGLKDAKNIPGYIISGLVKGITNGIPDVIGAVFELAKGIIDGICDVLGIHSPSRVMIAIGGFIIAGLIQGILEGNVQLVTTAESIAENVWLTMKTAFSYLGERLSGLLKGVWEFISNENGHIDWGKIFAGGMMGSLIWILYNFTKAVDGIADGIGGIGDILDNAGKAIDKFGKVLSAYSWDLRAKALMKLAISIGILAGIVVLLAQIDDPIKLWNAVRIIAVLSGVLVALAIAMDKMTQVSAHYEKGKGFSIDGLKSGLMQIALAIGILALVVKMIGKMDKKEINQGFLGLIELAAGLMIFMIMLTKVSQYASGDIDKVGKLMTKLAIAMGLMVLVFKMIDWLDAGEIVKGTIFAAAFAGFVIAITRVAKDSGEHVHKVGKLMTKLAFALGLMVVVFKLIDLLDAREMIKGTIFAAAFAGFVIILTKVAKDSGEHVGKVGGLMVKVAFAMALMVGVCKLAGKLKASEMAKGALFAAGFAVLIRTMVKILTIGKDQEIAKVTATILAMAVAVGILAAISVAMGFVNLGDLVKGVAAVSILCAMMALMVHGLKGANDVKASIMMMAIAIGVMTAAIIALTFIDDTRKLVAASASIAIVMGMFALIEKNSRHVEKAWITMGMMTIVVAALAGILYLLASNLKDADAAIKGATAIGILMSTMAASLKIMSGSKINAYGLIGTMGVMVGVVAALAIVLGILSAFEVAPSIETATSLSILLVAMAGVTAILAAIGPTAGMTTAGVVAFIKVVSGIGLLIGIIGGFVTIFPKAEEFVNKGIPILEKIGEGIGRFIGGVGEGMMDSLNDMVDTFGLIIMKLVAISNLGTAINTEGFDGVKKLLDVMGSIALTTVGTSLGDVANFWLNIFSGGGDSMHQFQSDGVAFFKAMKAIGEAATGITVDEESMDNVISAGQKLADLQGSLEPIGGVISFFTGRDDLATFGKNAAGFIGSMALIFMALEEFEITDTAKTSLETIVSAAGELAELQHSIEPIGGVIAFFKGRDDLGAFGANAASFVHSMAAIFTALSEFTITENADASLKAIIAAATELAELQHSLEPIGGVIAFFKGQDDLGTFGWNVASFIFSMKIALAALNGAELDSDALESVITASTKLAELQSTLEPVGGVIDWFAGQDDLGTFGDNVKTFAEAMGTLKTEMGEDGLTQTVIDSVKNAGSAIIELQKALPAEHWFDGKMDLDDFATYVSKFGGAMKSFGEAATTIDEAKVTTTVDAAFRIKNLIRDINDLDYTGMYAFTDGGIAKIASAMTSYSTTVADINIDAVATSVTAAIKLRNLIATLNSLDTTGIENFQIQEIGTAMSDYSTKVTGLDSESVASSVGAAYSLKSLIASLIDIDPSGVANFKPEAIGTAMGAYSESVKGFDLSSVVKSVSVASKLKQFISSLANINTSGVSSFVDAVEELGSLDTSGLGEALSSVPTKLFKMGGDMVDGLAKGFKTKQGNAVDSMKAVLKAVSNGIKSHYAAFTLAGTKVATSVVEGAESKSDGIKTTFMIALNQAVGGVRTYYDPLYRAGKYIAIGMANGIEEKTPSVVSKARAMANAAAQAAKEALKINSPSKVFQEIGSGVPEGFALGIEKMSNLIDKPLSGMTSAAYKSVSDTVSRIATAIDSDMDVQPTIRPVLDLSDVRSGAGAISSMLDVGSSVKVLSNIGSISRSMNNRSQNVSNAEVVSAIDRLDKHLDNIGNTTYTINGITYDDGSNIAAAVRDITRFARLEGRA